MPRKSKAILGTFVAAVALVALMAVPALAGAVTVDLAVSPATATYGSEVVITPSIVGTETLPGDAITLEAWDSAEATWTLFGEGLKVEETGTVSPQYVVIDETFLPWYYGGGWKPVMFRATYKPVSRAKDASGNPIKSPSVMSADAGPSFTVAMISKVKVTTSMAKSVKHGRAFNVGVQTGPDAGIGDVRIKVAKAGYKTRTYTVTTDDSGYVRKTLKLAKHGRYKVSVAWLGSSFGPASKTVSKYIVVR